MESNVDQGRCAKSKLFNLVTLAHQFHDLRSLEGAELEFQTPQRPVARFVCYQFVITYDVANVSGQDGKTFSARAASERQVNNWMWDPKTTTQDPDPDIELQVRNLFHFLLTQPWTGATGTAMMCCVWPTCDIVSPPP